MVFEILSLAGKEREVLEDFGGGEEDLAGSGRSGSAERVTGGERREAGYLFLDSVF
jgi:hypothetical protein